ncbi:hypothetical protein [Micropruina sp.]|uniref:hypothetical protein n=1 Tax=Micropruina sp. TaxID=2737536 RepID=UPI0039E62C3F
MFTDDSAAITAAIRAGSIQQIQAEPTRRAPVTASNAAPRVLVGAPVGGRAVRR